MDNLRSPSDLASLLHDDIRDQERARAGAMASPQAQARAAYDNGDQIFQISLEVHKQEANTAVMTSAYTTSTSSKDTATLNAICREGWDLVTASFVFVTTGESSRDKFLSSGQQVAVSGQTVGYYLFRRNSGLRPAPDAP